MRTHAHDPKTHPLFDAACTCKNPVYGYVDMDNINTDNINMGTTTTTTSVRAPTFNGKEAEACPIHSQYPLLAAMAPKG